jgi:hypothetical protein
MSRLSLRALCLLTSLLALSLGGCRSGKKSEAASAPHPAPANAYAEDSRGLPPLPTLGDSQPHLLPGGPSAPLSSPPPRYRTSAPSRGSALSGPSLPLPAPPAEDF